MMWCVIEKDWEDGSTWTSTVWPGYVHGPFSSAYEAQTFGQKNYKRKTAYWVRELRVPEAP